MKNVSLESGLSAVDVLYNNPSDYRKVQEAAMNDDMVYFYIGYGVVFLYVLTVVGRRNCLEFKVSRLLNLEICVYLTNRIFLIFPFYWR